MKAGQLCVWTENKVRLVMYAFQFHSKVRGGRERQFIIIVLENTLQSYFILHKLAQYAIFFIR